MKTALIYQSKYGATEQIARIMQEALSSETKLINLKESSNPDIKEFSTLILGGSIYAGNIHKTILKFISKNLNLLLEKKVGLFICGMETGEKAQAQINKAYPEVLRKHAFKIQSFEGAFDFKRMNFIEKAIIKKITGISQSFSKINPEEIKEFIKGF